MRVQREKGDMSILRVNKDVRVQIVKGDMSIMRVRKDVRYGG